MRDLAVAAYFTSKNDPQRRGHRYPADHWPLIKGWYEGLKRCGMHGMILHDMCSDHFVGTYTDEHLSFRRVTLGPYTTNVDRFFHYLDLFGTVIPGFDGHVLFTDLFDITFNHDPFAFMKRKGFPTYFGVFEQFSPTIRTMWNRQAYGDPYLLWDKPYLAATAFGGRALDVYGLLTHMREDFEKIDPRCNVDMVVLHKCAWTEIGEGRIFYGSPFTGNLKTGTYGDKDCVVHRRDQREDHGVKRSMKYEG